MTPLCDMGWAAAGIPGASERCEGGLRFERLKVFSNWSFTLVSEFPGSFAPGNWPLNSLLGKGRRLGLWTDSATGPQIDKPSSRPCGLLLRFGEQDGHYFGAGAAFFDYRSAVLRNNRLNCGKPEVWRLIGTAGAPHRETGEAA